MTIVTSITYSITLRRLTKLKHYLIGNSVTSYIIAATLDYLQHDFSIMLNDRPLQIPPILLLKYKDDEELHTLFKIFKLEPSIANIEKYTKRIKVGYLYDGKIHSKLTDSAKTAYLNKQKRTNSPTNISDSMSSYSAILLNKIIPLLQDRYSYTLVNKIPLQNVTIYNTIYNEKYSKNVYLAYITKEKIDLFDYDYVYDCNEHSKIKRYSRQFTEYIEKPTHIKSFEIRNYYDEPTIYTTYNVLNNVTTIDIGRLATQSQLKQEDVIKYILKNRRQQK